MRGENRRKVTRFRSLERAYTALSPLISVVFVRPVESEMRDRKWRIDAIERIDRNVAHVTSERKPSCINFGLTILKKFELYVTYDCFKKKSIRNKIAYTY